MGIQLSRKPSALGLPSRRGGYGKARAPGGTLKTGPSSLSLGTSQRKSHIGGKGPLISNQSHRTTCCCARNSFVWLHMCVHL